MLSAAWPAAGSGIDGTTGTGSVIGSGEPAPGPGWPGRTESRSNSQGRITSSAPPVSSRAPSEARSSPNMAGSNPSSCATQSASSSRHVGGRMPSDGPSSSRARTAGTWPVAGSVQCGSSVWVTSGAAGTGSSGVSSMIRTEEWVEGSGVMWAGGTIGSSEVISAAVSAPMMRTPPVDGPDGSERAGGTRSPCSSSSLSGPSSTLLLPPQVRALGPAL